MELINEKAIVTGDKALQTVNEINRLGQKSIAIQSDFTEDNAPELFLKSAIYELYINCNK
jgi:hypothetical protein